MQNIFPHQLPRVLGKYEFIVYYLLLCAEQQHIAPVSRKWILENMPQRTSPNTVTAALRYLCAPEQQLARRATNGWRIMSGGRQLFLGVYESEMRAESAHDGNQKRAESADTESQKRAGSAHYGYQKRAERAPLSSSSRDSLNQDQEDSFNNTLLLPEEKRAERAAVFQMLMERGVYPQKAKTLSELPWATFEYVQRHMDQAESEGWEKPVGMAIYRIEAHAPMPAAREDDDDDRHKYVRGPLAYAVNRDEEDEEE